MEPRIQYAKTEDGVRIAYATYGEGEPLVFVMNPAGSHVQLEWEHGPVMKVAITFLAAERLVVRFDQRGVGLSDRDVFDISLDARVRDLEAVANRLQLDSFELVAVETGGHPAIAYAVKHPERVTRLVLINCYARGQDASETTRGQALGRLQDDWRLLTDTVGAHAVGMGHEDALLYGAFIRECMEHDMWVRLNEAEQEIDVSDLLPGVRVPTLNIRHRGIEWLNMDATRKLAAGIPDSQLVTIEGLYPDRPDQMFNAISEFLDFAGQQPVSTESLPSSKDVRTILFTDMASSTSLADQFGDSAAREVRRAHNEIVREALSANAGSEIKHTGDGIMASFSTASSALDAAIAIQQGVAAHKEEYPDSPLGVYIGLNAGEPIAEEGDLFGTSINLAARICDHAEAGQILAANVVRELAAGKQFLFSDLGETELRGFEDPVKLWEVRWRE